MIFLHCVSLIIDKQNIVINYLIVLNIMLKIYMDFWSLAGAALQA